MQTIENRLGIKEADHFRKGIVASYAAKLMALGGDTSKITWKDYSKFNGADAPDFAKPKEKENE